MSALLLDARAPAAAAAGELLPATASDLDEDWVIDNMPDAKVIDSMPDANRAHLAATDAVDAGFLAALFPTKAEEKRAGWLDVLAKNEFETVGELAALDPDGWSGLVLPAAIKSALRQAVTAAAAERQAAPAGPSKVDRDVEQLDMVVMDISGSMRATSVLDVDKTREDVSKMLFHTMVDKTLHFEVDHAVGLLAFGEKITPVVVNGESLTTEYERFHDELGRLDATERRTTLWDSIAAAADMLDEHQSAKPGSRGAAKRIFVLTDGEDNASSRAPWEVARMLQDRGIVLDAIPLAGANSTLHAMCTASRGLCFQCNDQEQSIALFEREATLRLCCREDQPAQPLLDNPAGFAVLRAAAEKAAPVVAIKSAVPQKVFAPALSAAAAQAKASSAAGSGGGGGGAATRRVMKEYGEICSKPLGPNWRVYVSAENSMEWKAVLSNLPQHYAGGSWLLSISFPTDYPFAAPAIRFVTPFYHCNVSPDGMICLDLLQSSWSPGMTVRRVLAAIQDLALSPDALNPLDAFKGALYRDDLPGYLAAAAAHTLGHAAEPFEALAARCNLPFDEEDTTVTVQTKTSTETTTTTTQVGGCV